MDFPIDNSARLRRFPSPEEGLRAVREGAPVAEAVVASWIERVRPLVARVYLLRRRIATIAVMGLAAFLFVQVMFSANGMVVYQHKKSEYESLQRRIAQEQQENDLYAKRIQSLKSDGKAIEKEAREQLRYARPGEYVYVPPPAANPAPPATHSTKR